LWGRKGEEEFSAFIMSLPTKLGRESSSSTGDTGFISLGDCKALSRNHAIIDWNLEEKVYKIKCLGKNGMIVAGKWRGLHGEEVLRSRTPIKIGPCMVYFLLPEGADGTPAGNPGEGPTSPDGPVTYAVSCMENRVQMTYSEMVHAAFQCKELIGSVKSGGITSGEIQQWAVRNLPEWREEGPKRRTLANGIQNVLARKYIKGDPYPSTSGKKGARWLEGPSLKRQKLADKWGGVERSDGSQDGNADEVEDVKLAGVEDPLVQ
ncbi:unnamed protein product, partial [Discosporangium mesarthrocarpum]